MFVAILAGRHSVLAVFVACTVLEIVRSFSSLYFPNTWQLALGLFLLLVDPLPAAGHRLAVGAPPPAERPDAAPGAAAPMSGAAE